LLSVSRNSVRRVIKGVAPQDRTSRYEDLLPVVQEHFHFCKGNAVRMQELLYDKHGIDIPYSTLTRLIRQLQLREEKNKARVGRYNSDPGQEAQHDTSPHRLILAGKKITAQCASLTLGYSRKLFIQYYPQFTRFEAKVFLTEAFLYMAGACGRCIIDNTSVIVAHGSGPDATIAPEMKVFGQIFGTQFIPHAVGDANRKGKVERNFRYVENNFLAARIFADWSDLNRQARDWCDTVANTKPKRYLGGISAQEVHILERPHLKPLPVHIPPVYKPLQRIVDMSGYVTVDTNRYSVPERLCGRHVEVLKSWEAITIYHNRHKVAEHSRLIDKKDAKATLPGHHLPHRSRTTRGGICQEEKALMGRSEILDRYVIGIKKSSHGSGRRKLQKLLGLQRTYPADAFEKAVQTALQYGLYDLLRLENLILSSVAGDFFDLEQD